MSLWGNRFSQARCSGFIAEQRPDHFAHLGDAPRSRRRWIIAIRALPGQRNLWRCRAIAAFAVHQEAQLPEVVRDDGIASEGVLPEDELTNRSHVLPGEQAIGELRALQAGAVAGIYAARAGTGVGQAGRGR